jgi:hypothetical protein
MGTCLGHHSSTKYCIKMNVTVDDNDEDVIEISGTKIQYCLPPKRMLFATHVVNPNELVVCDPFLTNMHQTKRRRFMISIFITFSFMDHPRLYIILKLLFLILLLLRL